MCRRCDFVGNDGSPDTGYTGRASGPKIVQMPTLPPRCTAPLGKVDRYGHALMWFHLRTIELSRILRRARGLGEWSPQSVRQWDALVDKLGQPKGLAAELVRRDPGWGMAMTTVASVGRAPVQGSLLLIADAIEDLSRMAKARAEQRALTRRTAAGRAWAEWVGEQAKRGGGALHKYAKRKRPPPEHAVHLKGHITASPQALVEEDLKD